MDELEHVLGSKQVLEPVLAQVAQPSIHGQSVFGQLGGEAGEQHLATVRGRHDPGGAVHRRAEEVVASRLGLPGMHSHAHAQWSGLTPWLAL